MTVRKLLLLLENKLNKLLEHRSIFQPQPFSFLIQADLPLFMVELKTHNFDIPNVTPLCKLHHVGTHSFSKEQFRGFPRYFTSQLTYRFDWPIWSTLNHPVTIWMFVCSWLVSDGRCWQCCWMKSVMCLQQCCISNRAITGVLEWVWEGGGCWRVTSESFSHDYKPLLYFTFYHRALLLLYIIPFSLFTSVSSLPLSHLFIHWVKLFFEEFSFCYLPLMKRFIDTLNSISSSLTVEEPSVLRKVCKQTTRLRDCKYCASVHRWVWDVWVSEVMSLVSQAAAGLKSSHQSLYEEPQCCHNHREHSARSFSLPDTPWHR